MKREAGIRTANLSRTFLKSDLKNKTNDIKKDKKITKPLRCVNIDKEDQK